NGLREYSDVAGEHPLDHRDSFAYLLANATEAARRVRTSCGGIGTHPSATSSSTGSLLAQTAKKRERVVDGIHEELRESEAAQTIHKIGAATRESDDGGDQDDSHDLQAHQCSRLCAGNVQRDRTKILQWFPKKNRVRRLRIARQKEIGAEKEDEEPLQSCGGAEDLDRFNVCS